MAFVIVKRKRGKWHYISKHITFNKRWNYLAYASAFADQVRVFKTKDHAIAFIDKKYVQYPKHVKFWKVQEYEKHFPTTTDEREG